MVRAGRCELRQATMVDLVRTAKYIRENFRPNDRIAVLLIQEETHLVFQQGATWIG